MRGVFVQLMQIDMKKLLGISLSCIFLLGITQSCSDYSTLSSISGVVIEEVSKEPIPGVIVEISPSQSGNTVITSSDGRFLFTDLDPREGGYTIQVTKDGYEYNRKRIEVTAGKESSGNIITMKKYE